MVSNLLQIQDPLAGKPVEIRVTVGTGEGGRGKRPILLSLGIEGQTPVLVNGRFSELETLITQSWQKAGVHSTSTQKPVSETLASQPKSQQAETVADLF